MALEVDGWIDGITATGVVIFGIIFGLFFIYRSKKTNAKLLAYLGLTNIFAGLVFMGVFVDFLFVIIQENIINTDGIVAILSYIWFAPAIITAMYIGAELLNPKKKKYIVLIFLVISLIFEIVIFIDPLGSFNFDPVPPIIPSANLIDYNVNLMTFAGILMGIMLITVLVFLGLGFLYKGFQSSGDIRKNFILLSAGAFCFCVFGLLEGLTAPGIMVIIVRIGYLCSFWFMYFGLK